MPSWSAIPHSREKQGRDCEPWDEFNLAGFGYASFAHARARFSGPPGGLYSDQKAEVLIQSLPSTISPRSSSCTLIMSNGLAV